MTLLDAARAAGRNGGRLRLIDTGKFGVFELEWLAEAGADLFTSDEARPDRRELGLLARACARGNSVIAFLQRGALTGNADSSSPSWGFLREIGRDGVDVHLSNRERGRNPAEMVETAHVCRKAGSRLVYYHSGPPEPGLVELARAGGWIHLSDLNIPAGGGEAPLADLTAAASASGAGLVIHMERGLALEVVRGLLEAGAFVLFKTPPADRRSSFGALERRARKRAPDRRGYYLFPVFPP
jgi:hypothetical protein